MNLHAEHLDLNISAFKASRVTAGLLDLTQKRSNSWNMMLNCYTYMQPVVAARINAVSCAQNEVSYAINR